MSASRFCVFDDSHWPLLISRFVGDPSNQEFEDYLTEGLRFLRREEPHVVITDLCRAGKMSSEQRQRQVDWFREHDEVFQRTVLGIAYVAPGPVLRLSLGVVFHLKRPSYPYSIASREGQALAWAINRLGLAGLHESAERVRRELGLVPE
jgi:hypothetical protein